MTDYGKIYRSLADDGTFSLWAFGSTSAVDTALDFDTHFNNAGHFPAAAFKFTSLELAGNPTIDLSNGGVTNLALISVGDITSGLPGGTLTFGGIDALLLASQNGSINLGSEITFQDIPTLFFYARGGSGDLTLASPIVGTTDLFLYAGRNITFNAGTNLILGGQFSARTASGNISVSEPGDITVGGSLSATVNNNGGDIGTGGNISLTTGGDLTTSSDAAFTVQNTAGTITNGGNITLNVGGNLSTQGQLSLLLENYNETANPAGHIGTGGNISLTTGGNLTADSMSVAINNRGGGVIGSGASLILNIGGALTTVENGPDFLGNPASLSISIATSFDNEFGNNAAPAIGGDATLSLQADSASIGGDLSDGIFNGGGTIGGNALLNFSVTHDVTITGDASIDILNANAVSHGGTIHGDATLQVSATNFSANSLVAVVSNRNGGVIDSNATLSFNLSGNLKTTTGGAFFTIFNDRTPLSIDPSGGSIGTDATLNISALSSTVGGQFGLSINNIDNGVGGGTGGSIGGNATINLNVTNSLQVGAAADFLILNESNVAGSPGGEIGGNASVNVGVSGDINIVGDATFQILNNDGGHIGGNANISVGTGGDLTANSIFAFINNHNTGSIGSGANLTFNIGGALVTQGDAIFVISNLNEGPGGGTIGSLASVDINAASISVGGFFQTFSGANGGGSITGNASNNVNVIGDLVVQGPIFVNIADTGFNQTNPLNFIAGGHIGGDATVTLAAQNITTSSTATGIPGIDTMALEASIYTDGQGTLGGSAIVNVVASQNISAPGTVFFSVANGNFMGFGPGTIGGDAQINVTAGNLSTGALFDDIYNYGGASIGGDAIISLNVSNSFTSTGNAEFFIDNSGGTIVGNAAINMNVSGTATVANDATVAIYGSDGAASAAINFNGGSYDAGGTFTAFTDGDGTITFNNASVHADVLKVGALGTNGVLNIGGGTLSADTTLKLYAGGSSGTINFKADVTLGGAGAKILAANSVTIFNNVTVTIGGSTPADVYTNNANYTGSGGNNSTTGKFSGAGANTQSLSSAPSFDDPPPPATLTTTSGTTTTTVKAPTLSSTNVTSSGKIVDSNFKTSSGKRTSPAINISSSDQLLSLLDGAVLGPGGKITVPASKATSNLRNSSGINAAGRLNAGRRAADIREARPLPRWRLL